MKKFLYSDSYHAGSLIGIKLRGWSAPEALEVRVHTLDLPGGDVPLPLGWEGHFRHSAGHFSVGCTLPNQLPAYRNNEAAAADAFIEERIRTDKSLVSGKSRLDDFLLRKGPNKVSGIVSSDSYHSDSVSSGLRFAGLER